MGTAADSAQLLCARFADVYPHDSAISHIRRLLDHDFTCARTHETVAQFRLRMNKVLAHMNSEDIRATDGSGLPRLCRSLRARSAQVLANGGDRLPHCLSCSLLTWAFCFLMLPMCRRARRTQPMNQPDVYS